MAQLEQQEPTLTAEKRKSWTFEFVHNVKSEQLYVYHRQEQLDSHLIDIIWSFYLTAQLVEELVYIQAAFQK